MERQFLAVLLMVIFFGTTAEAKVVGRAVAYEQGGVQLEGYLAYDDAVTGKRPGVIVVHEWWGLNEYARGRADQLARFGYVAFAVDMYGKGRVTKHPEQAGAWAKEVNSNIQAWRQRALAGLEVLRKEPMTDPERIAAIGYCFGGATVQQLAYSGADIRGVVSFHGGFVPPPAEQGKQVKAKILICHGAADPMVKPGAVEEYIAATGKSGLDWQLIIYGGAKHSFTNPDADKVGMEGLAYSKSADQRSWADMQVFFKEIFGSP
jgi:dienelactone hydrolase